jgi:hypothetical protein
MPAVTSKIERVSDPQKIVTHVVTRQSTEKMTPEAPDNPRSFRQEHVDGIWTLVEEYMDASGQEWQGQIDGTIATEPLETHVIFKTIPEDIKSNWLKWKAGQVTDPVNWSPDTAGNQQFQDFYTRYSNGFQMYYAPRITLRANGVENDPPDQSTVGLVDIGYANKIPSFRSPENMDFILTGARGVLEGNVWRNSYEWLGSAGKGQTGKWDADIYTVEQS